MVKKFDMGKVVKLMKLGVVGYPVEHSLSPELFNTKYFVGRVKGIYEKISVSSKENLYNVLLDLYLDGYDGVNVTMPYKETVIDMVNELGNCAKKVSAVNTIVFGEKKWVGYNTDYLAYKDLLLEKTNVDFEVYIFGAGGAARAIAYAAKSCGFKKIYIYNRTFSKAKALADEICGKTFSLDFKPVGKVVIVNATSSGMNSIDFFDVDFDFVDTDSVVCDVVYTPKITKLINNANNHGLTTITGYDMLCKQAELSYSLFYGRNNHV